MIARCPECHVLRWTSSDEPVLDEQHETPHERYCSKRSGPRCKASIQEDTNKITCKLAEDHWPHEHRYYL